MATPRLGQGIGIQHDPMIGHGVLTETAITFDQGCGALFQPAPPLARPRCGAWVAARQKAAADEQRCGLGGAVVVLLADGIGHPPIDLFRPGRIDVGRSGVLGAAAGVDQYAWSGQKKLT